MGFMKITRDMENFDKFLGFMGSKDFSGELNFLLGMWFLKKNKEIDRHYLRYLYGQFSAKQTVDLDMVCFYTFGTGVSSFIYDREEIRDKSKFKQEEEDKYLRGFRIYSEEEGEEED